MTRLVLDASVVAKWFNKAAEPEVAQAYDAAEIMVVAPRLLFLEILNSAARRWRWEPTEVRQLARVLDAFRFEPVEAPLESVAAWAARGLTAYDASYVALAESQGIGLITADKQMLDLAPGIAVPLSRA